MKDLGDTWENFLIRNFFQDPPELPEGSSTKKSRRRRTSLAIQNTPTSSAKENSEEEPLSETLTEIIKQTKKRGKTKRKFEEIYQTAEHSSEEDQLLFEKLVHIKEQSKKEKEKGKIRQVIDEEKIGSQSLRRSSRLKGRIKKTKTKEAQFIDLGEETPTQSQDNISFEQSPQHSPQLDFESIPKRVFPWIDLVQY